MPQFAQIFLVFSIIQTITAGIFSFSGRNNKKHSKTSIHLFYASAASAWICVLALGFLFLKHDYRVLYVQNHADETMGTPLLLAAIWAGQEGSVLFWAALQSLFGAVLAWRSTKNTSSIGPWALVCMSIISVFFLSLVYFKSNPFIITQDILFNAGGINPLLRNPYMLLHPPTLFVGFAGFSVPLALTVDALIKKNFNKDWLGELRTFVLIPYIFLSLGNILGMIWAYQVLGWGGYWGWDPVENASLMPWIMATALLHTILAQRKRHLLKNWNIFLPFMIYALIILGTFITRSGILDSVHSFSGDTSGPWFLFLIAAIMSCYIVLIIRYKKFQTMPLKSDKETPVIKILTRNWFFQLCAWLFLIMTFFILTTTMWPFFMELFTANKISLPPSFYNKWMIPLGLCMLFLLGTGNLYTWEEDKKHLSGLIYCLLISVIAGLGFYFFIPAYVKNHTHITWVSLALCIVIFSFMCQFVSIRRVFIKKNKLKNAGGHIVHLAMITMFLGFTGGGLVTEKKANMNPGDFFSILDTKIRFLGLRTDSDEAKDSVFADLAVKPATGKPYLLSPGKHFFHSHPGQATSRVEINSSWSKDLFIVLGNTDFKTQKALIMAMNNPLVYWIWVGSFLLILGIFLCTSWSKGIKALIIMNKDTQKHLKPFLTFLLLVLFCAIVGVAVLDLLGILAGFIGSLLILNFYYLILAIPFKCEHNESEK
jgi:cytochrome c-type biogenesis protein CcmF